LRVTSVRRTEHSFIFDNGGDETLGVQTRQVGRPQHSNRDFVVVRQLFVEE
jgi:hypothetical protein